MTTIRIAIVAAALAAAGAVQAANLEAGKQKAQEICQACHGMDGQSAAFVDYPKIGGQHQDYLAKALRDYRSGARKNPVMGAMAATLTPLDIDNVTAYYARQPGGLAARF
ncbi:cytochrome subunit of sulfide dehydrogenase [Burkholderiales bacterium]|nr:cytochrome subunit of sulfide dehydrogenase [Burkholderiales bacterium]